MTALTTALVSTLIAVLVISFKQCLSQTTIFNETTDPGVKPPTTVSVTTEQSSTETITQSQPQRLCTPLSGESAAVCQLQGRNSDHTYFQSIPGKEGSITTSPIEVGVFAIEPIRPPKECSDAFLYIYCFFVVRPCDPIADSHLPICERSCEAFTKLRSTGACAELDGFIADLVPRLMGSFEVLSNLYFGFDCRNRSTYDFYDMLNFTQDGSCTNILSPEIEDKVLSETPVCQPVPTGICSALPSSTGYYFPQHDYHNEDAVMELLNNMEISITNDESCRNTDILTDLVCLFVYPPCVPETRTQPGICDASCTLVSTFIKECLIVRDVQNLPITELFYATIMNISCSQAYLIPGIEVDQNRCIDLRNSVEGPNYNLLIILVSSIVGSLAVTTVAVSVVIIFIRLRQRRQTKTVTEEFRLQVAMPKNTYECSEVAADQEEDLGTAGYVYNETTDVVRLTEADKKDYRTLFSSALISYDKLKIGDGIGEGAFGKVFKGEIQTSNSSRPLDVAIKTIKNVSSQDQLKAFFAESLIMKDFHHPNVLGLAGVCFDTPDGYPFLILPFMVNRSLKDYLRNSRVNLTGVDTFPKNLPQSALVQMCMDIARGMKYLAEMKFVHRDLAARNCMVDAKLSIKVGDFGLARDVYSSDYYRANKNAKLPVKWMPPETLHDGISNEKTDVWSYGVTCWEVFSLGRTPYPGISNHDILKFISSGGRLDQPTLCPREMYSIMKPCWELKPEDRPNFSTIFDQIEDYFETEHAYVIRSFSTDHAIPS